MIIGVGTVVWLAFLLAAVLNYRFDGQIPEPNGFMLAMFTGAAYVTGIVVDRLARLAFGGMSDKHRTALLPSASYPSVEMMERFIIVSADSLGQQIQYNRSRLRICRAWTRNFLLVGATFTGWNIRVGAVNPRAWMVLATCVLILAAATAWVTILLSRDHYANLRDGYEFLVRHQGERLQSGEEGALSNKALQPSAQERSARRG